MSRKKCSGIDVLKKMSKKCPGRNFRKRCPRKDVRDAQKEMSKKTFLERDVQEEMYTVQQEISGRDVQERGVHTGKDVKEEISGRYVQEKMFT